MELASESSTMRTPSPTVDATTATWLRGLNRRERNGLRELTGELSVGAVWRGYHDGHWSPGTRLLIAMDRRGADRHINLLIVAVGLALIGVLLWSPPHVVAIAAGFLTLIGLRATRHEMRRRKTFVHLWRARLERDLGWTDTRPRDAYRGNPEPIGAGQ